MPQREKLTARGGLTSVLTVMATVHADIVRHYKRIRGLFQLRLFLFRAKPTDIVAITSIVLGIVVTALSLFNPIVPKPMGLVILVLGLICFVLGLWRDSTELARGIKDYYVEVVQPNSLAKLSLGRYSAYEQIDFHTDYAIYCPEVNRRIAMQDIIIKKISKKFELDDLARSIAPVGLFGKIRSGAVLYNDRKVRMSSDIVVATIEDGQDIVLQPTDYYSGVCTNEMTCKKVRAKADSSLRYDGFELISSNGILRGFPDSKCSNHVGVSTLAITLDGYIAVVTQAERSAQNPCRLAPSGSGSADLSDLKHARTLQDFVITAMERELAEECGIGKHASHDVRSHVIGFARHLNRGGKPEFFGVSFLRMAANELRVPREEADVTSNVSTIRIDTASYEDAMKSLRRYQTDAEDSFCLHLFLNIRFLQDALASSPLLRNALLQHVNCPVSHS